MKRQLNRNATAGYCAIVGEFRMMTGDPDVWGNALGWLFGVAEVLSVWYGVLAPDFKPSPLLSWEGIRDGDYGYEDQRISDFVLADEVTEQDLIDVYRVLSRYASVLRLAGLDY